MPSRFYTYSDLKQAFGLNRTRVWSLVRRGQFPAPRQITPKRVVWLREEVDQWACQIPPVQYAGADQ